MPGDLQAYGRPQGLRPALALAQGHPHGVRLRYIAGCRCAECRRANTDYETARAVARKAGDWNGLVPALRTRQHLLELSAAGVGRRQVADAAGVADSILSKIIYGQRQQVRARTERAVLAVTTAAVADHAVIDAGHTWALLDELLSWGYTKGCIALALGYKTRALQIRRTQCTARTAYDVQQLHARLRRVEATPTARRIAELRDEGYRPDRITQLLAHLAAAAGRPAPDLTVRCGFIDAAAADLVARLHAQLTEAPV